MTNESHQSIIDQLNGAEGPCIIFKKAISPNVEVARVWLKAPALTDRITGHFGSDNFFLIKNEQGQYVATVEDRIRDLHWYVAPGFRGKSFLTKALRGAILYYLFERREGGEAQRITISKSQLTEQEYDASRRVANSLRFKPTNADETEFILEWRDFDEGHLDDFDEPIALDPKRQNALKQKVAYAACQLKLVSDELLMSYGDDSELAETAMRALNHWNDVFCLHDNFEHDSKSKY